jgi:hypothetical protein
MPSEINLLDDLSDVKLPLTRRRSFLPVWIKIFIWLFMIFGTLCPVVFIAGLSGFHFSATLYGLSATDANSLTGILITAFFLFKGIVAGLLWTEADLAVSLAIVDGIAGIVVCLAVMFNFPFAVRDNSSIVFRAELLFLVPYVVKMVNIRKKWGDAEPGTSRRGLNG